MGGDGGKAMLGGTKDVSVDDPEVKKAAEFAVQQLAGQSNSLVPPKLKEVVSASSKVESGTVYSLKLKMQHGTAESIAHVDVTRTLKDTYELGDVKHE